MRIVSDAAEYTVIDGGREPVLSQVSLLSFFFCSMGWFSLLLPHIEDERRRFMTTMMKLDERAVPQLELPLTILPTAHGDAWLVKPGKPRQRANWIRVSAAARMLNRDARTVRRYIDDGLLESRTLRPFCEKKGRSGLIEVNTASVERLMAGSVREEVGEIC